MRQVIIAALLVSTIPSYVKANAGIFFGSGHTIALGKSEQIQLVSEDVTVSPHLEWQMMGDSVTYRCKFVLKNLTAKPTTIQAGFPLDSQFAGEYEKQSPTTDLVLNYRFIARDEKTTYHVRFAAHDSEKKFSRLFLWDMAFDGKETKTLSVAYQLGMSQGVVSTRKDPGDLPGARSSGTQLWKPPSKNAFST